MAGRPEEYFEARRETGLPAHPGDYLRGLPRTGAGIRDDLSPPQAPEYSSLLGLASYREHLERTFRLGTTPNGVFAAKLMWSHVGELCDLASDLVELRGREPQDLLEHLFGSPAYVWVTRRDKVRQAVSLWRALQTRIWRLQHSRNGSEEPELHYRFAGIEHLANLLAAEDEGWRSYFSANQIVPLTVVYEDDLLGERRDRTVRAVLDRVGIAPPPGWTAHEVTERQADALSEAWVASYHRDAGPATRRS